MEDSIGPAYLYLLDNDIDRINAGFVFEILNKNEYCELDEDLKLELDEYIRCSNDYYNSDIVDPFNNNDPLDPYDTNPFKNSSKIDKNNINQCINEFTKDTNVDVNCTICMDCENNMVTLKCNHVFCKDCITNWLTNYVAKCPNCNACI